MSIEKAPNSFYGATLTAHSTGNTKGSYAELLASTAIAAQGIIVTIAASNGVDRRFLVDIALGALGVESVIVANIPFAVGSGARTNSVSFYVPVNVPLNSRVAARCQSSITVATCQVSVQLISGASGAVATTLGATTASSAGTQIDPGGSANTKGAYVELTASLGVVGQWLSVIVSNKANSAPSTCDWGMDIALGAAAAEVVIVPSLHFNALATWDNIDPLTWSFPVSIPLGSRIAVRAACSTTDATDRLFDVVLIVSSSIPALLPRPVKLGI